MKNNTHQWLHTYSNSTNSNFSVVVDVLLYHSLPFEESGATTNQEMAIFLHVNNAARNEFKNHFSS